MNKTTKRWLLILGLIVIAIGMFFIHKPKEVVPEFVFSYAENQVKDYPTTRGGEYFAQLVEERTGGRIKILVQYGGVMGNETEVIEQLTYGGLDFARLSLSELTNETKELNVLQMPYLYQNSDHMWKVLDGEIGNYFLEYLHETKLIGLSWYDGGARNFYTSGQPIRKLEDLQGLKIRVQDSELMADMIRSLGADPVKEPYSEVYSLLEKAEVQGAENSWPSYESTGHYEVAKYYTIDEHSRIPELQVCSKHTWERLSEEDKQIIMECAKESAVYQRTLWDEREQQSQKIAIDGGVEVIYLSRYEKQKFQQAVVPLYERYCKEHMDLIEQIQNMN